MKKLKQFLKWFLITIGMLIIIVLFLQIKLVRFYMSDYVWNVCEYRNYNGELNSSMYDPSPNSPFYGFYKLELCWVSLHPDNDEYLVKLRDAKTNKIYKTGFSYRDTNATINWYERSISVGIAEGSVCFYLLRKNDPNKELIEAKIGQPITDYDKRVDSDCI